MNKKEKKQAPKLKNPPYYIPFTYERGLIPNMYPNEMLPYMEMLVINTPNILAEYDRITKELAEILGELERIQITEPKESIESKKKQLRSRKEELKKELKELKNKTKEMGQSIKTIIYGETEYLGITLTPENISDATDMFVDYAAAKIYYTHPECRKPIRRRTKKEKRRKPKFK